MCNCLIEPCQLTRFHGKSRMKEISRITRILENEAIHNGAMKRSISIKPFDNCIICEYEDLHSQYN